MRFNDLSSEELLDEFNNACTACYDNEEDIGASSWCYEVRQELLARLAITNTQSGETQ